jgi:hypothetical protein
MTDKAKPAVSCKPGHGKAYTDQTTQATPLQTYTHAHMSKANEGTVGYHMELTRTNTHARPEPEPQGKAEKFKKREADRTYVTEAKQGEAHQVSRAKPNQSHSKTRKKQRRTT